MKLRNKRTGEVVVEINKIGLVWNKYGMPAEIGQYDSIAELLEEWEDYEPKEPLIKDEKIRKAVRAWADKIGTKMVRAGFDYVRAEDVNRHGRTDDIAKPSIEFDEPLGVPMGITTIAELCGEEEE